ncbi:MAG: DUF192 domain-containing protein [Myxococcaceae bacterium]
MPLRAINSTRSKILASEVAEARTFSTRLKGLLGRSNLRASEALHLVPCSSVHTFFMRFTLDALFLAEDGTVVALYPALQPWRATRPHLRAHSVLELPTGTLATTDTQPGDRIVFEPC